jgi:pimeloyl-ACP methyl ester carboxylesterase
MGDPSPAVMANEGEAIVSESRHHRRPLATDVRVDADGHQDRPSSNATRTPRRPREKMDEQFGPSIAWPEAILGVIGANRRPRSSAAVLPQRKGRAMLEVIDKGACSQSHPVPLLFVHGAWHAAWCWDEHVLDFFADKGYRALAVSLRGHGNSPSPKPLRTCSLADYVDDVDSVADTLPTTPVLIGHSMGGFIVQKYLESHQAPAGVLLASAPRRGSFGFAMRLLRMHPWLTTKFLITGNALPIVGTPQRARESFFSPWAPEAEVARYAAQLNGESRRVVLDTLWMLPKPERVTTPLLVLGAERDRTILPKEVRATARAYHTEAEIFPNMGHAMMLEPEWAAVAERIHTWLETHDPARKSLQSG